jgi:hypothetical protein
MGRGALRDDMMPAAVPAPVVSEPTSTPRRRRRPTGRHLVLAGAALAILVGLAGVVRTNMQMTGLQKNGYSQAAPLSVGQRFLPGVIVSPGKYLSAVNGSSAGASASDPLYDLSVMELKQAMDRWEALAGIGLAVLLFLNATRATNEETSVGTDVAPFVLVAAFLFAALSLFELP